MTMADGSEDDGGGAAYERLPSRGGALWRSDAARHAWRSDVATAGGASELLFCAALLTRHVRRATCAHK
jgi:hypothetical protein